uniref:F-box domain-containing protein n=1 Tax=viral metagenome TaxID=1070528 RepID=A0A6C0C7N7_9ZZZZ
MKNISLCRLIVKSNNNPMELPADLFYLICDYANVSSIRILYRTNSKFYKLGKKYINKKIYDKNPIMFGGFVQHYCMEKFTIELGLDGFNIPMSHYVKKNKVICSVLAYLGRLSLLKKAIVYGCKVKHDTPTFAARSGYVDILHFCKTLLPFEWDIRRQIENLAAANNQLDVLIYLDEHDGITCYRNVVDNSTEKGHLNILQWCHRRNPIPINQQLAVKCGHLHILKWSAETCLIKFKSLLCDVIFFNQVHILRWIIDEGHMLQNKHYKIAIENDATDVIKWILLEYPNPPVDLIRNYAVVHDKKHVFQILIDCGHVIGESMFQIAMNQRSKYIMTWMVKQNILTHKIKIVNQRWPSDVYCATVEEIEPVKELLLARNLIHLDTSTCIKIIQWECIGYIVNKIHNIPKSPYHFIIGNSNVNRIPYDDKDAGNGQKLFYFDADGQMEMLPLGNGCNCWWYLLACTLTGINKSYVSKMKECSYHKDLIHLRC